MMFTILKNRPTGTKEFSFYVDPDDCFMRYLGFFPDAWPKPLPIKVIFLDIDEVLTSRRSQIAYHDAPHIDMPESWYMLDQLAIGMIRQAVEYSKAKVVLSSTWRIGASREELINLSECLGFEICDVTSTESRYSKAVRGHQIQDWLDDHPNVSHYAIIDDGSDFLTEQFDHLVQTDILEGFIYRDYVRLLKILDIEEKLCS